MKLYLVRSHYVEPVGDEYMTTHFSEFVLNEAAAKAAKRRLKKLGHEGVEYEGVDVPTTREAFRDFANRRFAHTSWRVPYVARKLEDK